jgi:hypothetical protein
MRVATHDGSTIIDMGDEPGKAIRLDRTGWEIIDRSPIPFARTSVTMPMTNPVRGGSVNALWELVDAAPDHRRMFLGWMVAALVENIPHPIMTLRGEQGAAKSTAAKVVARVIDPSAIDFSQPPKDEDRWDSSCGAHRVVAVDNVSKIPDWWSDELCRAVTGGRLGEAEAIQRRRHPRQGIPQMHRAQRRHAQRDAQAGPAGADNGVRS